MEKVVATPSKEYIWVVDESKLVEKLGAFKLPVEVVQYGAEQVFRRFERAGYKPSFREKDGQRFVTDMQNFIIDLALEVIEDPIASGKNWTMSLVSLSMACSTKWWISHRCWTRRGSDFNFNKSKIIKIIRRHTMSKFNRNSLGGIRFCRIGAAPDANNFVNAGVPDGASDTLGHISKSVGLNVPNMAKLGLGNIPREQALKTVPAESNPTGYATKLEEVSLGKDTMTGHWGNHGS